MEETDCLGMPTVWTVRAPGLVQSATLGLPGLPGGRLQLQGGFSCCATCLVRRPLPGGEQMTSLAEAIRLALSQECWDNFKRWPGGGKGERGLPFQNPVWTVISDI